MPQPKNQQVPANSSGVTRQDVIDANPNLGRHDDVLWIMSYKDSSGTTQYTSAHSGRGPKTPERHLRAMIDAHNAGDPYDQWEFIECHPGTDEEMAELVAAAERGSTDSPQKSADAEGDDSEERSEARSNEIGNPKGI